MKFKQIVTAYGVGSTACVVTGTVTAGLLDHWGFNVDYVSVVGLSWLVPIGVPSLGVASDSVLKALGKPGVARIWARSGHAQGRKVPVNYPGRTSHVFLSALPFSLGQDQTQAQGPPIPYMFVVAVDGITHHIDIDSFRGFLHKTWSRQRAGKSGLSRNHWIKTARPPLTRDRYDATIALLLSVDGLIVDRGPRRSGRMALPPELTIKSLQAAN